MPDARLQRTREVYAELNPDPLARVKASTRQQWDDFERKAVGGEAVTVPLHTQSVDDVD
jgi:hypothetical protein